MSSSYLGDFLDGLVELPEMGYYDYDWERFVSYYDPTSKMFYWVEGSGCSCNDLWDDVHSVGDMQVGRKSEFLSAASEFSDVGTYGYGQGRYSPQFQTVREAVDSL